MTTQELYCDNCGAANPPIGSLLPVLRYAAAFQTFNRRIARPDIAGWPLSIAKAYWPGRYGSSL